MFRVWWLVPVSVSVLTCACGSSQAVRPPAQAAATTESGLPFVEAAKQLDLETAGATKAGKPAPILGTMRAEITRTLEELRKKGEPVPYFLAYQVIEQHEAEITASRGALVASDDSRWRSLDVDVRLGSHELDNRHELRGEYDGSRAYSYSSWLPVENAPDAIRDVLWLTTHHELQRASEELVRVQANQQVKVEAEDDSDDFSREPPQKHHGQLASLSVDIKAWEKRLQAYSTAFRKHPLIHYSAVTLGTNAENRFFVSSEGSSVQVGATHARLTITATSIADDGMVLNRTRILYAHTADKLPRESEVREVIEQTAKEVLALREAPLVDPYAGPAILDGRAAGVFFHEVFGHRVEGHRQKSESEGQTFSRKVGEQIMPAFLDVYDDPTLFRLNGIDLNGFYPFDDEGVRAQRASLVNDGVLEGFLMSRSPVKGFDHSNGHGRRERGHRVFSRQGNLVVDPSRVTSRQGLVDMLLAEVERQGKPYGLRFADITGGYTVTSREEAQAFKVMPVMVYRVYPDGRQELVRGVDIEGTPLTALSRIVAAANDFEVFNGMCGGESGWLPVSASSPSLLVSQIEIARREKGQDRPPLLPPPPEAAP